MLRNTHTRSSPAPRPDLIRARNDDGWHVHVQEPPRLLLAFWFFATELRAVLANPLKRGVQAVAVAAIPIVWAFALRLFDLNPLESATFSMLTVLSIGLMFPGSRHWLLHFVPRGRSRQAK